MRRNPQRAAWIVLTSAFVVWCLLVVLVPVGVRWWILNAASDQTITMTSRTGNVLVQRPGRPASEVNLIDIPVGSTLTTLPDAQASLNFAAQDGREVLATVQIYGNAELLVERADTPRFGLSPSPHRINLYLIGGRARVLINTGLGREVLVLVRSTPGAVTQMHAPGNSASIEAGPARSIVTVREGEVLVIAQSQGVRVSRDQRAEVVAGEIPNGPLPAERNLVIDGDFQLPLDSVWRQEARPPQDPSESPGQASVVSTSGRRAANFLRSGVNWGEVGITQEINQDVRDFTSLRLQLDVLLSIQDLYNCGQQGTECPVMVRIRYLDTGGGEREWLQGFYYNYSPSPNIPRGCPSCAPPVTEHQRVPNGQWTTFESGNLLERFAANGLPAAVLKSITLYASGHTFDSQVTSVQLLAEE